MTFEEASLTQEEEIELRNWLVGLGRGIYHDGNNLRTIGHIPLNRVKFVRENKEFSDCLYAICGNASLRLRAIGKNGNIL